MIGRVRLAQIDFLITVQLQQVRAPKLLSFTEWDSECQQELSLYIQGMGQDACLFGDVSSFWRQDVVGLVKQLAQNPSMAVETLAPLICSRKAVKRQKECFLQMASSHCAGSSCTAHSRQGKQLGLADPNVLHLLVWAALRLEIGEPDVTLENVEDFPTTVVDRLWGSAYFVEPVLLDLRMFGHVGCKKHLFKLFASVCLRTISTEASRTAEH